jgi:hypothetical protein
MCTDKQQVSPSNWLLWKYDRKDGSGFNLATLRISPLLRGMYFNYYVAIFIALLTSATIIHSSNCQLEICLQCGESSHPDIHCIQNLEHKVSSNAEPPDTIETLQWKLKNSRPCPSCSIMINRDEGCNKVDCSLCGHAFCWSCRSSWSEVRKWFIVAIWFAIMID